MNELFVKQALNIWTLQLTRLNRMLELLSDEQLARDISPGKNSGLYILGHLIAINDGISQILGTGVAAYPALYEIFVSQPDKIGLTFPSTEILKNNFQQVHDRLNFEFVHLSAQDWFAKHNAVSDEDFLLNPERTKLSVLLNRANHLSFHLGQLRLLY